MKKVDKKEQLVGREAVTHFLRSLDGAAVEAIEMFNQWVRRQPYRLDPEDRLAQDRLADERTFRERIKYLRRKKLIATKKIENGLLCSLTDEGRVELLKRIVQERPSLDGGNVCLVIYDIPTDGNLGRDALRYFLKRIGFIQVQKSVWQTDKQVVDDVLEFIRSAKIQKWVEVYLARKQD